MTLQRKRPVQRAHTGLVGMPYEPEPVAPAPVPEAKPLSEIVETPARKRGRPLQGDKAKSPAERQRDKRNRDGIARVFEENKDDKGRLHNERSGEAPRKHGASEMERIVAAQDRDENGKRITPTGRGPTFDEQDGSVFVTRKQLESNREIRPPAVPSKEDWAEYHRGERKKTFNMVTWAFRASAEGVIPTNDNGAAECRCCGFLAGSPWEAERHIEEAWEAGKKLKEHFYSLLAINETTRIPSDFIGQARKRVVHDQHFMALAVARNRRKRGIS
jgi:hypothetical protein